MSSSSSSASKHTDVKRRKRKRETAVTVDSDDDSSNHDSSSDSEVGSEILERLEPPLTLDDDEPVLSHAALRKQRKQEKSKQARKEEDEEAEGTDSAVPNKKRKVKDGSAVSTPSKHGERTRRQNSVWIGNMSFKTTEENLRLFFKDKGAGEITRINLPTKSTKGPLKPENRGFAYVDFDTVEAKRAAIALSEQPLLGRKLLIKDGDDFAGRPGQAGGETSLTVNGTKKTLSKTAQRILKNQKQPPAPTLFFGNLGFDTTEDSIQELLEAHRLGKGKQKEKVKHQQEEEVKDQPWIRKVRLGTFEDSGKCKGFAFVDFSSIEYATFALVNPRNHHLNGRELVVEYAGPDAVRRGALKVQKPKHQQDATNSSDKKVRPPHVSLATIPPVDLEATPIEVADDIMADIGLSQSKRPGGSYPKERGRGKPRGRPKPGAALALAKRASVAIVPSQGQKITF